MSVGAFKKIVSSERELNQIQDNISQALRPLLECPLVNGRLIEDIAIVSGTEKIIDHKLNRILRGWIVTRQDASGNVWESASTLPLKTLILNSSANITVSLWVF